MESSALVGLPPKPNPNPSSKPNPNQVPMEVDVGGLDSFHLPVASCPTTSTSTPTPTSTPTTSAANPTTSTSAPIATSTRPPGEDPALTPVREEHHFYTALRNLLDAHARLGLG